MGISSLAIQETKVESDEATAFLLTPFLHYIEVCVSHANGLPGGLMLFKKKKSP